MAPLGSRHLNLRSDPREKYVELSRSVHDHALSLVPKAAFFYLGNNKFMQQVRMVPSSPIGS